MDYKDIANRLRKWANGETCEDCPAKTDLAFCAADAIYDLLSRVEAIRPVSREQVEKVWGSEWEYDHETIIDHFSMVRCSKCGREAFEKALYVTKGRFCPACGAAMTDEAVQMVVERLEALHGET